MVQLVSIKHPTDPSAEIPMLGCRGPLERIQVPEATAKLIAQLGFEVTVHEVSYDPIAAQAAKAKALAAALSGAAAAPVEKPAPAPAKGPAPAPAAAETSSEDEGGDAAGEGSPLSAEEVAALREQIAALDSQAKAKTFIAEYGITIDPSITKLRDIKAALIGMIDAQ